MAGTHGREMGTGTAATSRVAVAGGVAGLAGGVGMGLARWALLPSALETMIPALYGLRGSLAGWVVHLFHATVFGLVFGAGVRSVASLRRYVAGDRTFDRLRTGARVGIAYAVVLWFLGASVVQPLWLGLLGVPGAPPVPTFDPTNLVGHVVYGTVLGVGFPLLAHR
jgi:hypothetical protein